MKTCRLAVLISGRGSNLQALIDACKDPAFPADIALVVSNVPDAKGLERAADAGIPAMIVDHTYFKGDKAGFEAALAATIKQHDVDLVCLAGFMRILSGTFLNEFKDKVINIHPSLLPAHKGLDTHEKAIAAGDKHHGCSVHVVTEEMDAGAILGQRKITVKKGDTPETLAERVLVEEHSLYPEIVRAIALGNVIIRDGQIETPAGVGHHNANSESERKMAHTDAHGMSHANAADAGTIENAQAMWNAFTKCSMYAGGAVALVLVFLAVFVA